MTSGKRGWDARIALLAIALALPSFGAAAQREAAVDAAAAVGSGLRLQLDNDLFAGSERDRDYTGGFGVTISGDAAREGLLSLDPLLAALSPDAAPAAVRYARQFGLIAFTPQDIIASAALADDRPYASLLFTSNGRVSVDPDGLGAWSSNVTVGVLGLSVTQRLHRGVHELVGSEAPHGYRHQISAGGEPTARYALARHHLWVASATGKAEVKTTLQGSVGYLTEASAAISLRLGQLDSPWWSFAPELTDYMAAPLPVETAARRQQLYFFAGARIKARAYNAFLQGQLRDSDVRYSLSEVEPVVAEAWLGMVSQLFEQTELSYTLRYQTAELRDGKAARDALWGSVQLTHSF